MHEPTNLTPNAIATLYQQKTNRQPKNGELFLHEGTLWVYRSRLHSWEGLGSGQDPAGYQGTGMLEFELQDGIMLRGSPGFVMSIVLRAFYEVPQDKAQDFVQFVYNIFKECGWHGPAESDIDKRPGQFQVSRLGTCLNGDAEFVHILDETVDDVRPILSQLQDPNLNGWVSMEVGGATRFVNVQKADKVSIVEAT